jgi:Type II secretion system protein C
MTALALSPTKQSLFTIAGLCLVAAGFAAGIWYGRQEVHKLDAPLPFPSRTQGTDKSPSPTQGKVKANLPAPEAAEVILSHPRYARPPIVFDPGVAIAAAMAASAAQANKPISAKPQKPAPTEINPGGWAGKGASIDQAWESNAQADWNVRATPLTAPNWRISGVVQRGSQTQVIVLIDGEPNPKFFKIGDTLPGGAKLAWVQPEVVGVVVPKGGNLSVPVLEGQNQAASKPAITSTAAVTATGTGTTATPTPNKP